MQSQDLFDIADSVIRTAQKLKNGANVHDFNSAIASVQMWVNHVKHADAELCDAEVIDDRVVRKENLLLAINRLRSITAKEH
jgi:hypothetical protein